MTRQYLFNVLDLVESEEFAEFFTILKKLTGIFMTLANPDGTTLKILYSEEELNPLCQVIHSSSQGKAVCAAVDKHYANQVTKCKHGLSYLCHAGLVDFVVPIYIEGWHIASIIGGQMLPEKPSAKGFKK